MPVEFGFGFALHAFEETRRLGQASRGLLRRLGGSSHRFCFASPVLFVCLCTHMPGWCVHCPPVLGIEGHPAWGQAVFEGGGSVTLCSAGRFTGCRYVELPGDLSLSGLV